MKNYSPVSCGINRLISYLISKEARLSNCFKSVLVVVKLVIAQITANKQHNKKNHIAVSSTVNIQRELLISIMRMGTISSKNMATA